MMKTLKGLQRVKRKAEHKLREQQIAEGIRTRKSYGPKEPSYWWKETLKRPLGQRASFLRRYINQLLRDPFIDECEIEEISRMRQTLKELEKTGPKIVKKFEFKPHSRLTTLGLETPGFLVYTEEARLLGWITKHRGVWYAYTLSGAGFSTDTRHRAALALLREVHN